MGSLATVSAGTRSVALTTSAFGDVTVANSELGVFIGENILTNKALHLQAVNAIGKCLNALRDSGLPAAPTAANCNKASMDVVNSELGLADVVVTANAASKAAPDEDSVMVVVGSAHQPTPTAGVTSSVERGLRALRDVVLKKSTVSAAMP